MNCNYSNQSILGIARIGAFTFCQSLLPSLNFTALICRFGSIVFSFLALFVYQISIRRTPKWNESYFYPSRRCLYCHGSSIGLLAIYHVILLQLWIIDGGRRVFGKHFDSTTYFALLTC